MSTWVVEMIGGASGMGMSTLLNAGRQVIPVATGLRSLAPVRPSAVPEKGTWACCFSQSL
jgi:hypothetical protein